MHSNQKLFFMLLSFLIIVLFINSPDRTPVLMLIIGVISNIIYKMRGNIYKNLLKISPLILLFIIVGRYFAIPILKNSQMRGSYFLRLLELFDLFNAQTFLIRYSSSIGSQSKWGEAISNIMNNIIFGAGTGSGTFNRISSSSDNKSIFVATHSDYLSVLLETGIIGFIIFSGILFIAIKSLLSFRNEINENKLIANGIFISLISVMACSVVNVPFFIGESRIIWLFLGLIPLMQNQSNFIIPRKNILF